jgi:hypothetical protein
VKGLNAHKWRRGGTVHDGALEGQYTSGHFNEEHDPDLHYSEKSDPDLDTDPHDPDPHLVIRCATLTIIYVYFQTLKTCKNFM